MTLLSSTGDLPARLLLSLLVVGAIVSCLALMWRGWRARGRRQSDVLALPSVPRVPDALDHDLTDVPIRYLGASRSGDWLDRIVVHGLGVPSQARVTVRTSDASAAGVWLLRRGAPDVFVGAAELQGVRHDQAVAGRAYERDGVVVVTWLHGGTLIDLGMRVRDSDVADQLQRAVAALVASTRVRSTSGGHA